jgi:hypothetical protein
MSLVTNLSLVTVVCLEVVENADSYDKKLVEGDRETEYELVRNM